MSFICFCIGGYGMSITKSVKSPTRNNLIESAMTDAVGRNQDLKMFLKLLHNADEFSTIAINGGWGTGKTFFVKQAQLLIDIFDEQMIDEQGEQEDRTNIIRLQNLFKDSFDENNLLSALYFDAWLYDDVRDPLSAILSYISQKMGKKYGQSATNIKKLILEILKQISPMINISFDYEGLKNAVQKDYLGEVTDLEEIKNRIVSAFQDPVFSNKRLIFFIDELDRCNPIFALRLLEKVKHFFEDTDVLFVFSVNIPEFVATIRACYGNDFNAEQYLSKFFDIIVDLPPIDAFQIISSNQNWNSTGIISVYCRDIINEMHFSIRECQKFLDCYKIIESQIQQKIALNILGFIDLTTRASYLLFPILLIALKIKFPKKYEMFIRGEDGDILKQCLERSNDITYAIACLYQQPNQSQPDKSKSEIEEEIMGIYTQVFKADATKEKLWRLRCDILKLSSLIDERCVYE